MKNAIYIFIVFYSIVFSNVSTINVNKFEDNRIEDIILHLEPFSISTYIYHKYYPNYIPDYYENGYFIDGSLGLPIYQNISHKIYFNSNDKGTFTQLSYKQKKSDLFFDTKLALKTDINDFTNFIFKGESKSIVNNINQNYVLRINKKRNNSNFKIGYLYHIEDDPNIEFYQNINQEIESFHLGYAYDLHQDNIKFNIASSIQISNNNRSLTQEYIYDLRTIWNNLNLIYQLNNKFSITSHFNMKNHYIEKDDSYVSQEKNHTGIGIDYRGNNFNFNLDLEKLNDEYLPKFGFAYKAKYSKISIVNDNFIANKSLNNDLDIVYENINNLRLEGSYNQKKYDGVFSLGQIKTPSFKYMYYTASSNYNLKYSIIDFKYYYYDSDLTYFKENLVYGFTVVPPLKSDKYKMYGKISSHIFKINKTYDINIENINLFETNSTSIETRYNVNLLDIEFGFVFETFKISFIRKNPLENEVFINQSNLTFIRYDYIDVVWYFKD